MGTNQPSLLTHFAVTEDMPGRRRKTNGEQKAVGSDAPAPAPAPTPPAPAPAVPGFDFPAPAPANGPCTPTTAELRERRVAAFSSSEKEGSSTGTKRSHDTAFSGSQDSLSSIESVDSLSQLLSSRSDLTVLLNMLVQQELAKKIATGEDDNGPAKKTKM